MSATNLYCTMIRDAIYHYNHSTSNTINLFLRDCANQLYMTLNNNIVINKALKRISHYIHYGNKNMRTIIGELIFGEDIIYYIEYERFNKWVVNSDKKLPFSPKIDFSKNEIVLL